MSNTIEKKPLCPTFKVSVKGKTLDSTLKGRVQSIVIKDPVGGSKTLELQIVDPALEVIQDDLFVNEAIITASIGIGAIGFSESFSGYVACIDFSFPDSGEPVVIITGIDSSHLFSDKKKTRTWEGLSRIEVIDLIATEHGFTLENKGIVDVTQESIVQDNETDLALMERFIYDEIEGENVMSFGKSEILIRPLAFSQSSGVVFHYKIKDRDIMSFSPQITRETKTSEVEKKDIKSSSKETEKGVAKSSEDSETAQGQPVVHASNASNASSAPAESMVTFNYNNQSYSGVGG